MKNKNTQIISLIVIILLVGAGLYAFSSMSSNNNENDAMQKEVTQNTLDVPNTMDENSMVTKAKSILDGVQIPEGAIVYVNTQNPKVSYQVNKVFFSKPLELVTGTTDNGVLAGWYNKETNTFYVTSTVNLTTLSTDSNARDEEVRELLSKTATMVFDSSETPLEVDENGDFTGVYDLEITINETTQTVPFNITGNITDEMFTAQGTATVLMTDFGVTPPSLIKVYEVEPEVTLNFEVSGEVVEL